MTLDFDNITRLATNISGGGGGETYKAGDGIGIDGSNNISVLVDNDTISISDGVLKANLEPIQEKIAEIEAARYVNATVMGEPTIIQGQVSDFSENDYMIFPTTLDFHNKAFSFEFAFTLSEDVTSQQNILDSKFGLALAIKDGKGLMAISSNGTSWDIGQAVGILDIRPNTTYYARVSWNGILYKTLLSVDGETYTEDMKLAANLRPYPVPIYIGGCNTAETGHEVHPFKGTLNMNKAKLFVSNQLIWQGMDDVGLDTRLDLSLSNINAVGKQVIKDIASEMLGPIDEMLDELIGG